VIQQNVGMPKPIVAEELKREVVEAVPRFEGTPVRDHGKPP
jgi:hypothetical protein